MDRIFAGLASSGLYKGSLLPVLTTDMPLREALARLGRLDSAILPSSLRKIAQCKVRGQGKGHRNGQVSTTAHSLTALLPPQLTVECC